ncbi:hypothetical protein IGB42_02792 [Andreprevotia sp. IGB-42]|nr:hypothetical protein IGB42_02792 [Andreprevotia sp. IGB-42]
MFERQHDQHAAQCRVPPPLQRGEQIIVFILVVQWCGHIEVTQHAARGFLRLRVAAMQGQMRPQPDEQPGKPADALMAGQQQFQRGFETGSSRLEEISAHASTLPVPATRSALWPNMAAGQRQRARLLTPDQPANCGMRPLNR